jgi:hypothetical protein
MSFGPKAAKGRSGPFWRWPVRARKLLLQPLDHLGYFWLEEGVNGSIK